MERGVGSFMCYTLDHFLRWIFHFLVNATLSRLIFSHIATLLSQYPLYSIRSLQNAQYHSFLITHLMVIRIVLPCTWLLPYVITPLLNFCLIPTNILTFGLFMIPWLLCVQIYHIAVLHYFISTNDNLCYWWYCWSPFTPLRYLLVLNIYTIWSVVYFLCTYFHSIVTLCLSMSHTFLYTFLMLVQIQTAGCDEPHSPCSLIPTAHSTFFCKDLVRLYYTQ